MSRNSHPFPVPGDTFDCATPSDVTMIKLLGGQRHETVVLTTSQMAQLRRVYDYSKARIDQQVAEITAAQPAAMASWEKRLAEAKGSYAQQRIEREKPKPIDEEGTRRFLQTGADRNMLRHANRDGLRMVAFLARFVENGQDPVKLLVQLATEAGFDVGEHSEWAFDDEYALSEEAVAS